MSILIKGEKMPKNCLDCLSTLGLFSKTCPISDDSNIDVEFARHHIYDDCPLVEIPPHGRLIDADEYEKHLASIAKTFARSDAQKSLMGRAIFCLENVPTVIESEEQEHE